MIKNLEGRCPNCGFNTIVLAIEDDKIVDKYCAECGYKGLGLEIFNYSL